MSPCPVKSCINPVRNGHLTCRPCWNRTPKALQHAVNAAWGTVKYDIAGYKEARDELLAWHEANPIDARQGSLV
jgi:hypothetical protein